MFNKSDFKAFLSCRREFWLSRNHPGAVSRVIDPSLAFRIRQGYEVQRIANGLFPDAATEQTFQVGDVSAKVDQFEAIAGGGYVLREVKSGKTVSQEYLLDIAFQVYVARAAGAHERREKLARETRETRERFARELGE